MKRTIWKWWKEYSDLMVHYWERKANEESQLMDNEEKKPENDNERNTNWKWPKKWRENGFNEGRTH